MHQQRVPCYGDTSANLKLENWKFEDSVLDDDESLSDNTENSSIAIEFFQKLASLAPSYEVRELLFSLINDIATELLPPYNLDYDEFKRYYNNNRLKRNLQH